MVRTVLRKKRLIHLLLVTNLIQLNMILSCKFLSQKSNNYLLNDNKPTPELEIGSLRQEIESLKRTTAEERQRMVEEQRRAAMTEQQQIVEAFREEVGEYVAQHAETYELTSLYGGSSLVADVIEEHFRQTNKLLTIPEAAKLVEEHYEDPRLLQIKLLGEGVVDSILRGETVGITSRRSRAASQVFFR